MVQGGVTQSFEFFAAQGKSCIQNNVLHKAQKCFLISFFLFQGVAGSLLTEKSNFWRFRKKSDIIIKKKSDTILKKKSDIIIKKKSDIIIIVAWRNVSPAGEKQKYKQGEAQIEMKLERYSWNTPHLPDTPEQLQFGVNMKKD